MRCNSTVYTNNFYGNSGKITDFTRKNRIFGAFRTRKSPKNITKSPKLRKNRYGKDPEKRHTEGQWLRAKGEGLTGFDAESQRRRDAEARRCGGAEMRRCGGAESQRRRGAEMRRRGVAETQRRRDAETRRRGDAEARSGIDTPY